MILRLSCLTLLLSTLLLSSNALAQCPVYSNQWALPDSDFSSALNPLAVDPTGNVYVGDGPHIVKYTSDGIVLAQWGSFGTGDGQFNDVWGIGIAVDGLDNVYILDSANRRVERFTSSGEYVSQWPLQPDTSSLINGFSKPANIAVDHGGNYIYVTDEGTYHVQKYTAAGEFITKWGGSSAGPVKGQFHNYPAGVAVDPAGRVYVVDGSDVEVFTSDGDFITRCEGSPLSEFFGIAADNVGNIYVADTGPAARWAFPESRCSLVPARSYASGGPGAGGMASSSAPITWVLMPQAMSMSATIEFKYSSRRLFPRR